MKKKMLMLFILIFAVPVGSFGGELQERESIKSQVSSLFLNENFAELERLANDYRSEGSRTASGLWKLTLFYVGIDSTASDKINDSSYWTSYEVKTQRWVSIYPNSPTPHISHAILLIHHAWAFRGTGRAYKVRPENWEPFHQYIGKARDYLETNKKVCKADPRWYETMIVVAKAENWDLDKFHVLVEEAVANHPYFYQIYFAAIDYLTPKWHGDKEKIEEFANFAVKQTQTKDGAGMYARAYWYASQAQYGERLFTDSSVIWSKMKNGIDDVLLRYPDQWNINNFAHFACLSGDQKKAYELIGLVELPIPQVWKDPTQFDSCRAWAADGMATK